MGGRYSGRMSTPHLRRLRVHMMALRGLFTSIGLALAILGLGGVGFWWLDPQVGSLHEGLWLAFTTAATVGYGDIVPSTPASRAFAVLVVMFGLAVLSLVTASVAAIFVETEERRMEQDIMEELQRLRAELHHLRRDLETGRFAQPASHGHHPPRH